MPVRTRIILAAVGILVVVVLWFVFVYRPSQARIDDLQTQQEAARSERVQLEARLERLRQLQRDEPALRAQLARLDDAMPAEPRIPDFILQMHEAANLSGVPFLSIAPSVPSAFSAPAAPGAPAPGDAAPVQAINVTISTDGTYFELEDLIVRLERMSRAVRINSFSLSPGGVTTPGSPRISVSFSMQIFVATPTAPAAQPAPADATPSPSP